MLCSATSHLLRLLRSVPVALLLAIPLVHAAPAVRAAVAGRAAALGEVRYIYRGLTVQAPGQQGQPGRETEALYQRYSLRTAAAQRASIRFQDGTVLHMFEHTDAELRSPTVTYVTQGEVSQVLVPGTNHLVQTDTAVAAAIGTHFDVRIIGKQSLFIVLEGSLLVKNQWGSVYVKSHYATLVAPGFAPRPPFPYDADAAFHWTQALPAPDPSLDTNIALDTNGGRVISASSGQTGGSGDVHLIIDGRLDSGWSTCSDQATTHWVKVGFKGDGIYSISAIALAPSALDGDPASRIVKDFEVGTSSTSPDAGFATVYKGTVKQGDMLQRFVFSQPVQARYLELSIVSTFGDGACVDVPELVVAGRPATDSRIVACPVTQVCVDQVLNQLNATRAQAHLPPVKLSETQTLGTPSCVGSYGHSFAMAKTNTLWHIRPADPHDSYPADICLPHKEIGEAIGEGVSGDERHDLSSTFQLWMSDRHDAQTCKAAVTHACLVLTPAFTQVGIGIYYARGTTWLTVDFVA